MLEFIGYAYAIGVGTNLGLGLLLLYAGASLDKLKELKWTDWLLLFVPFYLPYQMIKAFENWH